MIEHPLVIIDADTFSTWIADLEYALHLGDSEKHDGVEMVLYEMKRQRAWRRDAQEPQP